MTPTTTEMEERRDYSLAWFAGAMGAGIGIAALAYKRRPRSQWDRTKDRANDLIETARKEVKPWMGGAAAGVVAAGTAIALYARRPKETGWQRAGKRAGEIASRVRSQATTPWANVAATAAISLVSIAYANKARRRTIRGIDANAADKINTLAERGLRVLRGIGNISDQAGKLYSRGRRAIA